MGKADDLRAVERLVAGPDARDVEVMNEVLLDDSILSRPQSGEIIRGRENRQGAFNFVRRAGRIVRETACWAKSFPAPECRGRWVDRA